MTDKKQVDDVQALRTLLVMRGDAMAIGLLEAIAVRLAELKGANDRLQAIVAKLPKCNRLVDGKLVCDCPVVPGMDIWTDGDNGPRQVAVLGINPSGVGAVSFHAVEEQLCFSLHGYSTREAAEAAEEK